MSEDEEWKPETKYEEIYLDVWKKLRLPLQDSSGTTTKEWDHWELCELLTNLIIEYKSSETCRCMEICCEVNRQENGRWDRRSLAAEIERRIDESEGPEWEEMCRFNEECDAESGHESVHCPDGKSGSE
jgi:hypothetical protein